MVTKNGKLDLLVNNAGIALEWDGKPTNADRIRRTLEVNLIAPCAITEALVPLLSRSDDARVINHSSMLGSMGVAESMWDQVGGFMTAHPGWVKTDLGSQAARIPW
jgi:NAD(P)-dependent dehydrogenase (short-subunit alcohol dehydrogenase family)